MKVAMYPAKMNDTTHSHTADAESIALHLEELVFPVKTEEQEAIIPTIAIARIMAMVTSVAFAMCDLDK